MYFKDLQHIRIKKKKLSRSECSSLSKKISNIVWHRDANRDKIKSIRTTVSRIAFMALTRVTIT